MRTLAFGAVLLLAATASSLAQGAAPPDAVRDLAPTGKLRAADALKRSGQTAVVAPPAM